MNNNIVVNNTIKTEIEDILDKIHIIHENWIKLKRMTETKLYKLMEASLELCYLSQTTESHMRALKECCKFKWGRKTKVSTLVAKAVFGHEAKQVHNYAKVLETAMSQKIGQDGHTDMVTWLRVSGGISGLTRNDRDEIPKSSSVVDLERSHNVDVGRNALDFGFKSKLTIPVDDNYLEIVHSKEVLMLCKVDRSGKKLIVYRTIEEQSELDNYFYKVGKELKETASYKQHSARMYAAQQMREAAASEDISTKISSIFENALVLDAAVFSE